jgi:RNA polymerase sigma-70 factor (ECF subfamily)
LSEPAENSLTVLKKEHTDDRQLVEAAQRDRARFADLYELYFYRVYVYVVRRVPSHEEAEDLTSEVFHHALKKLDGFESRGVPFVAWLYRIAANAIADRWQRNAREAAVPESEIPEAAVMDDVERRAALFQLVDALPAEQRRVVLLRFVEQKSIRDISHELKKTEGAVKQLQFRALKQLRSQMEGANA